MFAMFVQSYPSSLCYSTSSTYKTRLYLLVRPSFSYVAVLIVLSLFHLQTIMFSRFTCTLASMLNKVLLLTLGSS